MLILLSILSVIALIASLVILVYRFFKKRPKNPAVIALICSFVLCLVLSVAYNASLTPEERAAMQQQYQERKAKKVADEQAAQEEKDRIAAEKAAQKVEADQQTQQEEMQPADNQADSSDSSANSSDSLGSDFSAAISDTVAELMNTEYHPYVQDVSFSVDPDDKNITMMAVLNSSTNKRTALDFADTMIRRFSSNVVAHDSSYSMPSKDYYGSLFDTYKITIGVAPSSATDNPSRWYYSKVIYPGNHTQQGPHAK